MSKKVIIIGGSSGMGFAIAQKALEQGDEVVIASRTQEKLDAAKKKLGNVTALCLDVTNEEGVETFFSSMGAFDHLVISAADLVMGPFLKMETKSGKGFFESKFWGQYIAAKHAVPKIRKGGSITFFCGIAAHRPFLGFAAGAAINAAIEGLTRALAIEIAPIRVNAISPGTIVTPVWDVFPEAVRAAQFRKTAEALPVKRVGAPEDIAQAALYLMECGFVTGTILSVDGGAQLI